MTPFKAGEVPPLMQPMAIPGGIQGMPGLQIALPAGAVVMAPETTPGPFAPSARNTVVSDSTKTAPTVLAESAAAPSFVSPNHGMMAGQVSIPHGWQLLSPEFGAVPGTPSRSWSSPGAAGAMSQEVARLRPNIGQDSVGLQGPLQLVPRSHTTAPGTAAPIAGVQSSTPASVSVPGVNSLGAGWQVLTQLVGAPPGQCGPGASARIWPQASGSGQVFYSSRFPGYVIATDGPGFVIKTFTKTAVDSTVASCFESELWTLVDTARFVTADPSKPIAWKPTEFRDEYDVTYTRVTQERQHWTVLSVVVCPIPGLVLPGSSRDVIVWVSSSEEVTERMSGIDFHHRLDFAYRLASKYANDLAGSVEVMRVEGNARTWPLQ